MNIRKAVITAAGRSQRTLPLQSLVDGDGNEKTALQIILEEVLSAGVDEIGLITAPGDQATYAAAAGPYAARLAFIEQPTPRGYGHALSLARTFTAGEPFLHLVSDHLYISRLPQRCAQQVVERAGVQNCAISAVQATRETMLPYYGAVGGRRLPGQVDLYEVETVLEKPTPSTAEQILIVPGLRAGYYICFFGIHVLTSSAMDMLAEAAANAPGDAQVQLSPVLARLASQERYLALEVKGRRYNIGVKYGLWLAQLALALEGADRENLLSQMVELLALRGQRQ